MAKKTAAELGLKAEVIEGQPDTMEAVPDEFSIAPPPPYPGTYVWQLPADLSALWDTFERNDPSGKTNEKGEPVKQQRVSLIFDRDDPLTIVQSPGNVDDGQPFQTRINNAERNRAKRGEPPLYVSDLLYLIRTQGITTVPKTNQEYIQVVVQHLGGKLFKSDLEWTANCNKDRQAYVEVVGEGGVVTLEPAVSPEDGKTPMMGCDTRYYMGDWPRDEHGRYKTRRQCKCGASLRPFGQLRNFKPAS